MRPLPISQGGRVLGRKGFEVGLGWSLSSKSLMTKLKKETSLDPGGHCAAGLSDVEMIVPASTA